MRRLSILLIIPWATVLVADEPKSPSPRDFSKLPTGTWVKLSPVEGSLPSPRLGYEGACVWDLRSHLLIRYGGHNQGGGGEQGSEIWTFDPHTTKWTLKEPNMSPPGICCGQQNIFDPISGRYIRFPAFSASHGWQWLREVYLNDASVWTYDLPTNTWRNMRPLPAAHPRPLRCASWDGEHQVIAVFGGEGSHEGTWVYDPQQNTWTKMDPPQEPAPRSGGNMAYDPRHKVHVLFGSQFDDDKHTWTYDLRANTWKDMQPDLMPPTAQNDAVLTYDEVAGSVLAMIKITTGKDDEATHRLETWSYDVSQNQWTPLKPEREPDPTSNRARQLMFAPELGVALLENRPSNTRGPAEQQIWAWRSEKKGMADTVALPPTQEIKVLTGRDSARLTWQLSRDVEKTPLALYRGSGREPWKAEFQKIAELEGGATEYEDKGLAAATIYHYVLRSLGKEGRPGLPSPRASTQPKVVDDVVVSVLGEKEVEISWKAAPGDDIAGYHVERASVEVWTDDQLTRIKAQTPPLESPSVCAIKRIGPFTRLTKEPIQATTFGDTTVDLSKAAAVEGEALFERNFHKEELDPAGREYRRGVFAYRVMAVNALGVASGPSPAVLTIPSSPQNVFSKEEKATCHLRWQPNPEKGIAGYRVYRMDGRWAKDSISRLTDQPLTELNYSDRSAGAASRRYYIVAVDALGQEGFPSSPAWFNREWKPFYEPFVGEWHQ